jgi:hypothetical protein
VADPGSGKGRPCSELGLALAPGAHDPWLGCEVVDVYLVARGEGVVDADGDTQAAAEAKGLGADP